MGKIFLLCGKICSGKTHYAQALLQQHPAVALSCDELMTALFHHQEGEHFDRLAADSKAYLHKKAAEIAAAGLDVILDWGFWTRAERQSVSDFYREKGLPFEWHYIAVSDAQWQENIARRNQAVLSGQSSDYYVDEGLIRKLNTAFEIPSPDEMDVWHTNG